MYLCTQKEKRMETTKKNKHVNFSDGSKYDEIETILQELAPLMPKSDRGFMSRGILWSVRHVRSMYDDLQVNRERVSELTKQVEELKAQVANLTRDRDDYRDLYFEHMSQSPEYLMASMEPIKHPEKPILKKTKIIHQD